MDREKEWNRHIDDDFWIVEDEISCRFWNNQIDRIFPKYSFIEEFELESNTVDCDCVKNAFLEELQQLSKKYKKKLSKGYPKTADEYYLQFQIEGPKEQFFSKIEILVTGHVICLNEVRVFQLYEYRTVLAILSDLCTIDLSELITSLRKLYARYWINEKNAELAVASINTLCKNLLDKYGIDYSLKSYTSFSVISYENKLYQRIEKTFIHNEFNKNPGIVMAYIQSIKKDNVYLYNWKIDSDSKKSIPLADMWHFSVPGKKNEKDYIKPLLKVLKRNKLIN